MGWASGSQIAEEVWLLFKGYVPKKDTRMIAKELVDLFEGYDCDTMDEAEELMRAAKARK